jgi:hypothetical protein
MLLLVIYYKHYNRRIKIMSGIVGSKFNHRGSGLIGSLGTDGQHMLSSGAGKKHVFETVAAPAAYDDEPIKSDLTALALREATNESSAAFNLPSSFIDTFATDVLATKTDCSVNVSGFVESQARSATATAISYTSMSPATTQTKVLGTWTAGSSSYADINNVFFDAAASIINNSLWAYTNTAAGSGQMQHVDYKELKSFDESMWVGSMEYTSYISQYRIQYSTDDTNWTDIDFSGSSQGTTIRHANAHDDHTFTSGTSGGVVNIGGSGGAYGVYAVRIDDVPAFTARYLRLQFLGATGGNGYYAPVAIQPFEYALTYSATGTAIQAANTVASAKTTVGGTILYKDLNGTATLGTDLKIYFTCNGGTNWTEAASYNAITPVYSSGIKQVRLGETTCTSGTDVRYKAVWANQSAGSKDTQLHGVGINY